MAINIKNREAEALLRDIKLMTGKGPSAVILDLVRKEHERLRREKDIDQKMHRLEEIVRDAKAKIQHPELTDDELIGYDEDGLPT